MNEQAGAADNPPPGPYLVSVDLVKARTLARKFRGALARRVVRRAQLARKRRKVPSLQSLAKRAIAKARTRISHKYDNLNHILPPSIRDELMNSPETAAMCTEPKSLNLLLSKRSTHCKMDIPFAMPEYRKNPCPFSVRKRNKEEYKNFKLNLKNYKLLVPNMAKDGVRSLEVGEITPRKECENGGRKRWGVNTGVLRRFLHRLLMDITELHELSVVNWPGVVNRKTIKILGHRHKNLKRLVVRHPTENNATIVTKKELRCLGSRCSKLEELEVSGTVANIKDALPLFGELRTLTTSNPVSVSKSLCAYALQTPPPPPLKLDTPVTLQCDQLSTDQVVQVFSVFPHVTHVTMNEFNQETAVGLSKINNPIKILELNTGVNPISTNTQELMMKKFSKSMTELTIKSCAGVWDLGVIFQICSKLENLYIHASFTIKGDFEENQDCAQLIRCQLEQCRSHGPLLYLFKLTDELARCLFSSTRLCALILLRIELPGSVVTEIANKAQTEGEQLLDSLQELALHTISGVTEEDIISLICASPSLARIVIMEGGSLSRQKLDLIFLFGKFGQKFPVAFIQTGPPFYIELRSSP